MQVSAEEFGDEVAGWVSVLLKPTLAIFLHIFERGDEDIAEGDNLQIIRYDSNGRRCEQTFSCLRCLSSLSSRYVLLDRTGVLKGFMIFLTATFCPVS